MPILPLQKALVFAPGASSGLPVPLFALPLTRPRQFPVSPPHTLGVAWSFPRAASRHFSRFFSPPKKTRARTPPLPPLFSLTPGEGAQGRRSAPARYFCVEKRTFVGVSFGAFLFEILETQCNTQMLLCIALLQQARRGVCSLHLPHGNGSLRVSSYFPRCSFPLSS